MAVAPKSIAILFTPLITFQPFIHWQWFYNKIIWGEYSNCHQTIILGLYIFLDHILSRTIDQKFWWSTPTTLTLPCRALPPPFCHSFFLFLGLSVFSSFCLSVFLSFFLSVCLSTSKFILVHWQVDTGTESFFELAKIVDGVHFNIVWDNCSSGWNLLDGAALCDLANLFHLLTLD